MNSGIVKSDDLPPCCIGCKNQRSAENEWEDHVGWYCSKGIFIPTKKKNCKRKP